MEQKLKVLHFGCNITHVPETQSVLLGCNISSSKALHHQLTKLQVRHVAVTPSYPKHCTPADVKSVTLLVTLPTPAGTFITAHITAHSIVNILNIVLPYFGICYIFPLLNSKTQIFKSTLNFF